MPLLPNSGQNVSLLRMTRCAKADIVDMIFANQKDRPTAVSPKSDQSRMKKVRYSYPAFASAG